MPFRHNREQKKIPWNLVLQFYSSYVFSCLWNCLKFLKKKFERDYTKINEIFYNRKEVIELSHILTLGHE